MTEDDLRKLKIIYTGIRTSDHIIEERWEAIAPLLGKQNTDNIIIRFAPYATAFVASVIIILSIYGVFRAGNIQNAIYAAASVTKSITDKIIQGLTLPNVSPNSKMRPEETPADPTPTITPGKEKEDVKGVKNEAGNSTPVPEKNRTSNNNSGQNNSNENDGQHNESKPNAIQSHTNSGDTNSGDTNSNEGNKGQNQ